MVPTPQSGDRSPGFLFQATGFPAVELAYLSAAVDHLQTYLISDVLLWPLILPRSTRWRGPIQRELTLGDLCLSVKRLEAFEAARLLSPAQSAAFHGLLERLAKHRRDWDQAWADKALSEYQARLRQWGQYIKELASNPRLHGPQYPTEVTHRVFLQLLHSQFLEGAISEGGPLSELDQYLAGLTEVGPFLWPAVLERSLPPGHYWFLYRVCPGTGRETGLDEG